jgi:protein-L-isoaspartate(D-aspartate) O-methyltransferase
MDAAIGDAFRAIPRTNFLPDDQVSSAGQNIPLPIGYGQTNSQPETVELMLEWLEVEPGQHILDVGSGSGWTSALLAYLAGPTGRVAAVEIIPELVDFGRQNCENFGIHTVTFHQALGDRLGWPADAPYERILVSAAADTLPEELINQLKAPGRMVVPVRNDIIVLERDANGEVTEIQQTGFVFVPLQQPHH